VSGYLLLCAINSGRVAQVLDTTTGLKYPVALPKPGGTLDRTIARDGWTALKPGYSLHALPDHGEIKPTALTTAWTVCASANSRFVIANARHENEQAVKRIQLISVDGVERQVDGPFQNAVGDLLNGTIVTADALVDWDGSLHDLPSKGTAEGVISGRTILMIDHGRVKLVDARTSDQIAGLKFGGSLYSLKANPSGSALAQSAGPVTLVATATSLTLLKDLDGGSPVWVSETELLVGENPVVVVNIATGERTVIDGAKRAAARANLTGRFTVDEVMALTRPAAKRSSNPPDTPNTQLARSKEVVTAACKSLGLKDIPTSIGLALISAPNTSTPSLAGSRTTEPQSRLGGQPDLPDGTRWPHQIGLPMAFLGQFRLDQIRTALPNDDLPSTGLLSLFALIAADGGYPEDEHGVAVLFNETDNLVRLQHPSDLAEELRYGEASVTLQPFVSIPPLYPLSELFDEDAASEMLDELEPDGSDHRLFGYPSSVQGYGAADGWRLLFQLDADPIMETSFGDGGRLHLWIPTDVPFSAAIAKCTISLDSG
jgi:uncharacterized protein YwqG